MTSPALQVAGVAVSPDHCIDGQRVGSEERFELCSPMTDSPEVRRVALGFDERVRERFKHNLRQAQERS